MNWRSICLVLAVSGATAAQASFELMLMAGTEGIHRYDATNSVYLGKFGQNYGQYIDVVHDTSHPGEVLAVSGYGTVDRYNAYTGQYLGGFNIPNYSSGIRPKISVMNDGRLLITAVDSSTNTAFTKIYSNSGNVISTLYSGSLTILPTDAQQTPDGKIHVMFKYTNAGAYYYYLYKYNSSGDFLSGSLYESSISNNVYSEMSLMGNDLVLSGGTSGVDPTYVKVFAAPTNATGVYMNFLSYYSTNGMTNWTFGHNKNGYMIQGVTSGSYINKLYVYNPTNNFARFTAANVGTTDTISAISMINAPEPGAWIGIGVGCLGILMRRKRRARA